MISENMASDLYSCHLYESSLLKQISGFPMHWAVICARGEEEETLRKEKRGALGRGGGAEE